MKRPKNKAENADVNLVETSIQELRSLISHPDLLLHDEYIVEVCRTERREDSADSKRLDIRTLYLPANVVYSNPQTFTNRKDISGTVVLILDQYLKVSTGEKTRSARWGFYSGVITKLFEYLWLNDKFKLQDATEEDFSTLAIMLAEGGWPLACRIRERLIKLLEKGGAGQAQQLMVRRVDGDRYPNYGALRATLGTNLAVNELKSLRALILKHARGPYTEAEDAVLNEDEPLVRRLGYSHLLQTLGAINKLFDLPEPYNIQFLPYPDPRGTAKRLTKTPGSTRNMNAVEAGSLLSEAYRWLYLYGHDIVRLHSEACELLSNAHNEGRKVKGHNLDKWLEDSPLRAELEKKLGITIAGVDISRIRNRTYSLRALIQLLMTAICILIASMNARRRDEIIHPKFGLYFGSLSIVSEDLRIYRGDFYIEKTLKDYQEYFVNQTTRDCIELLELHQTSLDEANQVFGYPTLETMPLKERTLFSYQRMSRIAGLDPTRRYLAFDSDPEGALALFLVFAFGEDHGIKIHAHMFRRMYVLIGMYQYEIPSLLAIRQQLDHASLSSTQIYANDPIFQKEGERIRDSLGAGAEARSKAFAVHLAGIRKERNAVCDEKLIEIVISILSGAPASGGYPAYIKKFYTRVAGVIDFSKLSQQEKALSLAKLVKARGHWPTPFAHGICMAGVDKRTSAARCHGSNGLPQPEHASPTICGKCPFHYASEQYVINCEEDLFMLKGEVEQGALSGLALSRAVLDIQNLEAIIQYHRDQIQKSRRI